MSLWKRLLLGLFLAAVVCGGYCYWAYLQNPHPSQQTLTGFSPETKAKIAKWQAEQEKIYRQNPKLFDGVSAILFKADPMGINYKDNTDEYNPEATLIIARLGDCSSPNDLAQVLLEVFTENFDSHMAGKDPNAYLGIAKQIWALWKKS